MPPYNPRTRPDVVDNLFQDQVNAKYGVNELWKKRDAGVWVPMALENDWVYPGTPYSKPFYRLMYSSDSLETKGHVADGVSGTEVCTLLPPYRKPYEITFLTDIVISAAFVVGRVVIEKDTGVLTITYPAA